MKNLSNIIFLDTSIVLFPNKITHYREDNGPQVDSVAVNLINQLNKIHPFDIVLIDSDNSLTKDENEKKLYLHGVSNKVCLNDKWILEYRNNVNSPLLWISEWIEKTNVEHYLVLINEKNKHRLDFYKESNLNFNWMHFISEDDGLSFKNIQEIYQSFNLWI